MFIIEYLNSNKMFIRKWKLFEKNRDISSIKKSNKNEKLKIIRINKEKDKIEMFCL